MDNGHLTIVDLAGNEDYSASERKEETRLINLHNSTFINIIRTQVTGRRNTESKNEFTKLIEGTLKTSASVTIIAHSSYNLNAMRSSKFWLQQISNIISLRGKNTIVNNFEENASLVTIIQKYNERDTVDVSYGTEFFIANIIGVIMNDTKFYYKIHFHKLSNAWDEWVREAKIKE